MRIVGGEARHLEPPDESGISLGSILSTAARQPRPTHIGRADLLVRRHFPSTSAAPLTVGSAKCDRVCSGMQKRPSPSPQPSPSGRGGHHRMLRNGRCATVSDRCRRTCLSFSPISERPSQPPAQAIESFSESARQPSPLLWGEGQGEGKGTSRTTIGFPFFKKHSRGERTPLACCFRRLAEYAIVPLLLAHHSERSRFRTPSPSRAGLGGTRAACASQSTIAFRL